MPIKKKKKIIVGLGIGMLSTVILAAGFVSPTIERDTKKEPKIVSEKKKDPQSSKTHSVQSAPPQIEEVVKESGEHRKNKNPDYSKEKKTETHERVQELSSISEKKVEEDTPSVSKGSSTPIQQLISASAFAFTQYSHTTTTHSEGEIYAIQSTPVVISDGSISGTVTRTGIGTEKGSIILSYKLNFDSQGHYLSGEVSSSGYVNAQINLLVGEVYRGSVSDVITTSYGRALSGSLVYPVRVSFDLGF